MKYMDLAAARPEIRVETESEKHSLDGGRWKDVAVELINEGEGLSVYLTAEETPVMRVWLAWDAEMDGGEKILGDAWERGYGDLEWRGVAPERVMPWYMLVSGKGGTQGYGMETGPAAMCFWTLDGYKLRLCLDVRNGGSGVALGGRRLRAAKVISRAGSEGETAFDAAKALCKMMCKEPRLPKETVYGSNNWYYAYGISSAEKIVSDAGLMAELSRGFETRPFMVIDDGWQVCHTDSCNGGPWDRGNYRFPDMGKLAKDIESLNVKPGIWFRPLASNECFPEGCFRVLNPETRERALDPSHPVVLEKVEEMTRRIADWGYKLIKHDFSTYDIFGRWGFQMGREMTAPGWHFYDRSKTTAEIILNLYRAIRRGAGEDVLVLGCNTVSHLSAGIFEMQRTGDDTSGLEWERTRKMGVNTLAFRMAQHGAFYACDADCLGMTGKIDWTLNREWLKLLSVSGTPLFLSVDPEKVTDGQKDELRAAIRTCLEINQPARPVDWQDTTCPRVWDTEKGRMTFRFPVEE